MPTAPTARRSLGREWRQRPNKWSAGMTDQSPPLNGVRVLEYTQGLAGRTAGGLLADLGAEVVQVPADGNTPDRADAARVWSDRRKVVRCMGSTGRERLSELRRLIDGADVFLSDLSPG